MDKICKGCGITKALTEFYKHPETADGYMAKCKECKKNQSKSIRQANPNYYRAYDRERNKEPERAAKHKERTKRYKKENPDKTSAHKKVQRALKRGTLVKGVCEICGEYKTEAHHEDYSKPLNVKWLCSPCHHRLHAI